MFRRFSFCLLVLLVLTALSCPARAGTAYQRLETDNPASASWRDGLRVSFVTDVEQCRKSYGKAWPEECAASMPGAPGMRVQGVRLTPQTPGEWRWENSSTMRFTPSTPDGSLVPGTKYKVDVSAMRLPARVRLAAASVPYTAQPQAVLIGQEQVWIDPSPDGSHGVSVPLTFIWPADRAAVEKQICLTADSGSTGLRLGKTTFSWSAGGDSVVVSASILNLSDKRGRVALQLGDLASCTLDRDGNRVVRDPREGRPAFSFAVPGTETLFAVRDVRLTRGHDERLNARFELEITTTLRFDPKILMEEHLKVIEMPEKAEPGAARPTDWTALPSLGVEDLRQGRLLKPQLLTGDQPSDRVRMALPVRAGRSAAVLISKDLMSLGGLRLEKDLLRMLKAPDTRAELAFLQPGNILNVGGTGKLLLHSIGIDSVSWRARRVQTPFLAMYAATHGFSTEPLDVWQEKPDLSALTESGTGSIPVPAGAENEASFPTLDVKQLFPNARSAQGLVILELEGRRNGELVAAARRLLLITSLGLTVKDEVDGSRVVFVQSLSTGLAMSGVRVLLLARNGTVLADAETNASGQAILAATSGYEGEHEPVAVVARLQGANQDMSWLSLKDRSRVLDYGEFSTCGRHGSSAGLVASVFSQRDLYMPGDELHFGILVRRFDWEPLPAGLPLETVLTDPAGRVVQRAPLQGDASLAEISWRSRENSATGPYRLDVRVMGGDGNKNAGPVIGTCAVRVEEFEPDTLALQCELTPDPAQGWICTSKTAKVGASVYMRTLYGDPARQHAVRSSFVISPARLRFPGYDGYTFYDPSLSAGETRELRLPQVLTDSEGRAAIDLPAASVAGTFRGTLRVEGFEAAGGRAVTRQVQALFSPLSVLLGYRPTRQASALEGIQQGSTAALRVVAVNSRLKPAVLKNVTCVIANRRYVNQLVRDTRGEFRYDAVPLDKPVRTSKVDITEQGVEVPLRTFEAGDYLLTLKGREGETLLSVPYTVSGRELRLTEDGSSAALTGGDLRLRLNRTNYEPGDDVIMNMTVPYAGSGLITIEREKVVASTWFRCDAGETEQHIRLPADFEGQGYVNVFFTRAASSEAVYLKPQVYAAAPFTCALKRRDMGLKLETQESVQPGGSIEIRLTARRPGKALVFAVDEGILSLTDFASPDPLRDLLGNRALDVVTRQAFDLVMPDSARLAGRIPVFGGDMGMVGGRFLNPFRRRSEPPFAVWAGLVDVTGKGSVLSIPVPTYMSGRLRVMAVGSSSSGDRLSAGSAVASVAVRGSLLMHPVLPLAVTPGDVFNCALTVANTISGSGSNAAIRVTISPDSSLELVRGKAEQTVTISENHDVTIPFTLKARDELGSANVLFTAEFVGNGEEAASLTSSRAQTMSIRPPSLLTTTESAGQLTQDHEVIVERDIYSLDASTSLTVAAAPLAAFRALAVKLRDYPFGCTEQTISRAFPVLASLLASEQKNLLLSEPGVSAEQRTKLNAERLENVMSALRSSIRWNGVALWPGGQAEDFVTIYAGDFLLTLTECGQGVPADLLEQILNQLQRMAGQEPRSLEDARLKAYACWVLLRSGAIITQDLERLHAWLVETGATWKQDVTASLMADCFAMLRLDTLAAELMPVTLKAGAMPRGAFLSAGACWALHSYIVSQPRWLDRSHTGSEEDMKALEIRIASSAEAMREAVDRAFSANTDTVTMALTARALAGAVSAPLERHPAILRCLRQHSDPLLGDQYQSTALNGLNMLYAPGCRRFSIKAPTEEEGLYWYLHVKGYDRTVSKPYANGIEISRRYLDEQGKEITAVREGDQVTVELTLRAQRWLSNVAVVDLLPGGLEPLLHQEGAQSEAVTYNERREDRWLFFTEVGPEPVTLTYKARAAVAGTFQIPAVHAEAMYEPLMNATAGGGTLTVRGR